MPATIIAIDDADDPRVAVYRDIIDKDLRRGHGQLFMAESEMVVRQLARTPARLHSLLILDARQARMQDVLDALPDGLPAYRVSRGLAEAIAGFGIHRGVMAAGFRPRAEALTLDAVLGPLRGAGRLVVALAEGIGDVDNMGALFRNAAAFGVDAIVLDPTCCDPLYRKAVRTSIGHSLTVPFARSADWPADLGRLRGEWGLPILAAETAPGATPIWELPRRERLGILVGSEGAGLSAAALAACDEVCTIPMAAGHRSLNVGAALAVLMYELVGRPGVVQSLSRHGEAEL
jgi:tRNA G18 (ribose-2'-O)-methylase SpoU